MANDKKEKSPSQVNGTNAPETVTGTSASDKVDAKPGNDSAIGGAGNDWVKGGQGDDALDGGAGSDRVDGNSGNDRLIYTVGENTGASDSYDGGSGTNTLVLHMTRAEWLRDGMQADLAALLAFLGSAAPNAHGANSSAGFTFSSIGLNVRRIAGVEVFVDGVQMDPRDEIVTATGDNYIAATEHSIVSGDVLANDLVPDLVRSVEVVTGPALGSLALANDGSFSYDPGMAFDSLAAGETATATFTYRVMDADRDSATATNTLTITGTNDAPVANADTASTTENAAVTVDVLANDTDVDTSDTHVLDSVTIVSVTGPGDASSESKAVTGQGSVAIVDNRIQWTPGSDFDYLAPGDAATVAIAYAQNDGHGGTAASELDITVNGVNDAPILQGALSRQFSEQDAVFTLDLLQGASDVDRGAVLSAAAFAETTGKGGWTLEGNSL
ncbi:MAG: Ig-like domain-containing protein, partial [Gammaproteobacteria bacterium]